MQDQNSSDSNLPNVTSNMRLPHISTTKDSEELYRKQFGVSDNGIRMDKALKQLGISENGFKEGNKIMAEVPVCHQGLKQEQITGYSIEQIKMSKALGMLGVSQDSLEEHRSMSLSLIDSSDAPFHIIEAKLEQDIQSPLCIGCHRPFIPNISDTTPNELLQLYEAALYRNSVARQDLAAQRKEIDILQWKLAWYAASTGIEPPTVAWSEDLNIDSNHNDDNDGASQVAAEVVVHEEEKSGDVDDGVQLVVVGVRLALL